MRSTRCGTQAQARLEAVETTPEERDRWGLRGKTVWDWLRACANRKVGSEVDRLMPAEGLRVQGHCTPL
jgi:hypothetical protein